MREHELRVALTVRAPVLSQATAASAPGLDASMARRGNQAVLPGSLVKGKVLHAWTRLRELAGDRVEPRLETWLGQENQGSEARRGRLRFSDFLAELPEGSPGRIARIQLDPERGSVEHGQLAMIESPFPPGLDVVFHGTVRFVAGEEEGAHIRRTVEACLRWTDSVGALRSQGFGRLAAVAVEAHERSAASSSPVAVESTAEGILDLKLKIHDPLMIARFLPDRNLFECSREIPGGALKGALAATWRESRGKAPDGPVEPDLDPERPDLAAGFAQLRFTHAFLGLAGGRRPAVAPLSLVRIGDKAWDVATLDGPHLFADPRGGWTAPAFAPDWKNTHDVERELGWATPRTETRVRTAIDAESRRGAENKLFAYRTILPDDAQAFYGQVDFGRLPGASRAAAAAQLQSLLEHGLRHLGKTKASASVELLPAGEATEPSSAEGLRVLVLQSPVLLLDPRTLDERSGRQELTAAYREAWSGLADGLRLVRFFTRERLAGGRYLWKRFQADRPYHPFLLTDAGSVFVFEAKAKAGDALRAWQIHGLPLPGWAVERYRGRCPDGEERPGDDWRRNPFVPENGYGEVVVDRPWPWPAPDPEIVSRVEEVRP